MLLVKDPNRAKNIDKQNPRRLIRALEIILKTKKSIPVLASKNQFDVLEIRNFKITRPTKKKYK